MLRLFTALAALFSLAAVAAGGVFLLSPQTLWPDYEETRGALAGIVASADAERWTREPALATAALGLVAQEDERLYSRVVLGRSLPLDVRACARAAWVDLKTRSLAEGCSTLPMQVAKMAIPEDRRYGRSVSRKLLQIRLSLALIGAPPERVVAAYLDSMPCGSGITEGFEGCALLHFGRPASDLNAAEALLLAAAVQAPSRDLRDDTHARRRLALVLNKLWSLGWLPRERAEAIAALPLRRGTLRPDLVRANARGLDLALTQALGHAIGAARGRAEEKRGSGDDLLVMGVVLDHRGELLAWSGADSSWLKRPFEAGSWVKPFCAESLRRMPGVGADYLVGTEIPIRLPLRDRQLRPYTPRNAGGGLPERAAPMVYIMKSVNTASLAAMLYAHVYMSPSEANAQLSRTLSAAERTRYRSDRDMALSASLASAYAGMPLSVSDVPDLPGYREMTLGSVRACLAEVRQRVPSLQVPSEDLAALLGVVRAPLPDFGAGLADLWFTDAGAPTPIAELMAAYSGGGTMGWLTGRLGTPLTYKTGTAERNAGLWIALPLVDDSGAYRPVLLGLAAVRPSGADITPVQGGTLSPGVPAFLDALVEGGAYRPAWTDPS